MSVRIARLSFAIALACSGVGVAQTLPSRFEADRVFLEMKNEAGQPLRFYTDTGGGLFVHEAAVERLGLQTETIADSDPKGPTQTTTLPDFAIRAGLPAPGANQGRIAVLPTHANEPQLPGSTAYDGMLGQAWFDGHVWTWNYPGKAFSREAAGWRPSKDLRSVPIGFKSDQKGQRLLAFPRMEVEIDGKPVPLLLDTGAMTVLKPVALAALADRGPAERATSMIADETFQAWRKTHPEWRVIEDAQAGTGSAMIEVPEVTIAGWRVGPVWFTHRANGNFHDYMSSMMNARIDGALGGNAFRHFVMTVDYPKATAWFRCVVDCTDTSKPRFDAAAFAQLKFLVGRWRGVGPDGKPFHEQYDFPAPGELRSRRFADETFATETDHGNVRLQDGAVTSTWDEFKWKATEIADGRACFEPVKAPSSFCWERQAADRVDVTQRWTDDDGKARQAVITLTRIGD